MQMASSAISACSALRSAWEIDRDRAYAELPAGPDYSYRYLAAVGYEDFIYHCFLTSCVPQLISPGR
jgi:hypothetical protein